MVHVHVRGKQRWWKPKSKHDDKTNVYRNGLISTYIHKSTSVINIFKKIEALFFKAHSHKVLHYKNSEVQSKFHTVQNQA